MLVIVSVKFRSKKDLISGRNDLELRVMVLKILIPPPPTGMALTGHILLSCTRCNA